MHSPLLKSQIHETFNALDLSQSREPGLAASRHILFLALSFAATLWWLYDGVYDPDDLIDLGWLEPMAARLKVGSNFWWLRVDD